MRIVVAGALANKAGSGGESWVRMSWVGGLRQLGFDVWFVEEIAGTACTDPAGRMVEPRRSTQAAYFERVVGQFGMADRAVLLADGRAVRGPGRPALEAASAGASLVNISGHLRDDDLLGRFERRVHVDIDPGFTQFWWTDGHRDGVDGHDELATIGLNIGHPTCAIPTGGLDWWPVVQPVVLDDWPVVPLEHASRFTTVGNLRGPYGRVRSGSESFGLKIHEQRKVLELPRRVPSATFELAMTIHELDRLDRERLVDHGWRLTDPRRCADPADFRRYVQHSGAEFSVAQGIYVETASGWFSDRSVRYLASGRPVVVQDTGLAEHLPVGDGLLTFRSLDDAADAVARVLEDPARHGRAARRIAEEHFDARRVLTSFCARAGIELPERAGRRSPHPSLSATTHSG